MYTMYRNYSQLIKDVKRRKKVIIHNDIKHIAEKVATCKHITMQTELIGMTLETVLRYNAPAPDAIGTATLPNGVTYPVIGIDYTTSTKTKVLKLHIGNGLVTHKTIAQLKSYSIPAVYSIAFYPVAEQAA